MKPMKPLDMTVSETFDRKPFFVTEKKINIYVKPFSQDKCYDLPLFLSVVALWNLYMGWFRPAPVGIRLKITYLNLL